MTCLQLEKRLPGVKYSVQVLHWHFQEGAEKSRLCALPGLYKLIAESWAAQENHWRLVHSLVSRKGLRPTDKGKLEASELETEHNLLSFLPFCISTPEMMNCKYQQKRLMMSCRRWCHITLLALCSQRRCNREQCDGKARPVSVSPGLKVCESYNNVLLLEGFFPPGGHFHM